jgi:hypothetical protein
MKIILNPSCSPNFITSDFYLFIYLFILYIKKCLADCLFTDAQDFLGIPRHSGEHPKKNFTNGFSHVNESVENIYLY